MALELVTAASATEPLTIDEVKLQVKLPTGEVDHPENPLISGILIPAVRQRCEQATRRQMRYVTYDLKLDAFPVESFIEIPRPPLLAVTYVKYLDEAGVLQTLTANTDYVVSAPTGERPKRGRVALAADAVWPATLQQADAVTIRFTCGYGYTSGPAVPPILKVAMLQDAATLYADRENVVKGASVAELPGGRRSIYWAWQSRPTQMLPGIG